MRDAETTGRGKQRLAARGRRRGPLLVSATLAALLAVGPRARAQEITRGPHLQQPTTRSVVLVWDQDIASAPTVRFGRGGQLDQSVAALQSATHHEVVLDGLEPNETYDYGVFDGDRPLSQSLSFPTAVEPGTPFRFVALGDTRSDDAAHEKVIDQMATEPGVRFMAHTGDMVSSGELDDLWGTFFRIEQPVIGAIPLYPVIGNHEVDDGKADRYIANFALPRNGADPEAYYSFDYGNAHFVVLDSHVNADEWPVCLSRDKIYDGCFKQEQLAWLTSDLDASYRNPAVRHTVVLIHIGPYSSKEYRGGSAQMRELLPLLASRGVTLIVSGHDHYYERGEAGNGIPYIITGGGGAPLYELLAPSSDPHTVRFNASVHHYAVFDVEGDQMRVAVKDDTGKVIDTATFAATTHKGKQPQEGPRDGGCSAARANSAKPIAMWFLFGALIVIRCRRRMAAPRSTRQQDKMRDTPSIAR